MRRRVKKALVKLIKHVLPYLYYAYFRLVWATSRVTDETTRLEAALESPPHRFVCAIWHQDVICVPWVYRRPHVHTIASVGDAGEVISNLLRFFNKTVFRGGSSKRASRKRKILDEFTTYLSTVERPGAGITVDGSSGPVFRMKTGVIVMAMKLNAPIYVSSTWCRRRILLHTWDRTMLPLPFNRIVTLTEGPYHLPPHMDQEEVFQDFHRRMEDRLLNLTYRNFSMQGNSIDEGFMAKFPRGWKPSPTEETLTD